MRVGPTLSQLFNIVPSLMMQENAFDDGASLQDTKPCHQEQNRRADIIQVKMGNLQDSFPTFFWSADLEFAPVAVASSTNIYTALA